MLRARAPTKTHDRYTEMTLPRIGFMNSGRLLKFPKPQRAPAGRRRGETALATANA